jgi:hypothetical protein
LYSDDAAPGFTLCCDLRELRVPKMSMVTEVSRWSNDPKRKQAFRERCRGGRICVRKGLKFKMAKAVLTMLFKQCPISGPAHLLTSLEGKSESSCTFGPSANSASVLGSATGESGALDLEAKNALAALVSADSLTNSAVLRTVEGQDATGVLQSLGQRVTAVCDGCFAFLGASRRRDDMEIEGLKRHIEELSRRIRELECCENHERGQGIIGG